MNTVFVFVLVAGTAALAMPARDVATWNNDEVVGLVAPGPLTSETQSGGSAQQPIPNMVNLFIMTDPEMAGKAVESVIRTEDKILQERMQTSETQVAAENIKRQAPIDITKISLTNDAIDGASDYMVAPVTNTNADGVVDEEAEKLKQMSPPPPPSANDAKASFSNDGGFGSQVAAEELQKPIAAPAEKELIIFEVTKDRLIEPKTLGFSYDTSPNHSGIDISKISLTNDEPSDRMDAEPAGSSYSTTGEQGVDSVPSAIQENTWTKYPLSALIQEFMRGG